MNQSFLQVLDGRKMAHFNPIHTHSHKFAFVTLKCDIQVLGPLAAPDAEPVRGGPRRRHDPLQAAEGEARVRCA